jgi:hypothetical protein
MDYNIYVLTYKNPERKQRMEARLGGLKAEFHEGIDVTEYLYLDIHDNTKKCWATMQGHLMNIIRFYKSGKPYGVFCEDDVYIHVNFKDILENVIKNNNSQIVLLGYLIHWHPSQSGVKINEVDGLEYYTYNNNLWGTQCYLLTREYAKELIDYYNIEWAIENNGKLPYSSDWTITKKAIKRCLVYPPLAIEEGVVNTDHYGQIHFHKLCTEYLMNDNYK